MELAAYHMTTSKQWKDIVLDAATLGQLEALKDWTKHHRVEISDSDNKRYPGYRALFYGLPGSGKKFSAALIGKELDLPVYRVDLSMVVSKFIGETEKNISRFFSQAGDKGSILFFDEADALFGKRTDAKDSHDKYANLEIACLVRAIEDYNGLVILSTNNKSNIDDAFLRRLQAVICFPPLSVSDRKKLWLLGFAGNELVQQRVDLDLVAGRYALSPGAIIHMSQAINDEMKPGLSATDTFSFVIKKIESGQGRLAVSDMAPDQ